MDKINFNKFIWFTGKNNNNNNFFGCFSSSWNEEKK